MDTIFAVATAPGRAGLAVIRISGPRALTGLQEMMRGVPAARGLRRLHGASGEVLDEALVLRFDRGHSFTGEDVVELHLHGSSAVVAAILKELGRIEGFRQAEAGEFTRRAMENGRLDLAQVEGLAALVDAETEAQRRMALRVFSGALGARAEDWRKRLIRAAALIEATIDFADEDVPVDVAPEVTELIVGLMDEIQAEATGVAVAERLRSGFEVAIVGPPNVGKSSLLNRLAGRDAAITSEFAGTTRDVIEVRLDLDGLPVTMLDTAGMREAEDVVEGIGIARGRARAEAADLRIFLTPPGDGPAFAPQEEDIVLRAKADLHLGEGPGVSGLTGEGVDALVAQVSATLRGRVAVMGVAMRERHRDALERAIVRLRAALELVRRPDAADLAAEEIRGAIRAVDSLIGRVDVEQVLDEIFASFCIGK
ncbi:MAG: tRNA uridine-5-carboxymethylaminomethyl(34) synthesis GTPase MnmE [Limimaricola sp.]|uniref:tRNA uridine-5-carboxymethylaminomethyl(34) synthesis GTPase MnmE n=1 Tax=Limimaricola sp. TaxID=2211665 RepID=UPI001D2AF511|nr:tRNA uridine-5-carboxymethylaminomethyl(34) synthesis GTPase MnmE [Limimaricola sp.]MBI1417219.1 tRNA uridine-5-carboxymethylaminomethyl(34) synthesis GTPase MnmE [Limimaricola sp.]